MNHYGPRSIEVEHLKIAAGGLTLTEVERRLRNPPQLTQGELAVGYLRGWRLEEPDPRELAQSFYGGIVALSSQGRLVEYGNAFADVLRAFPSNGRSSPSPELEEMVRRSTIAKVGGDLLLGDDFQSLMVKWVRIVALPRI